MTLNWECFADKKAVGDFRVEAIDSINEGNCYVTIFSGPEAKQRAAEYASFKNNL